ncbi:MAG: hypothetical protein ACO1TE_19800 [Prosthecobacter sp.]
MWSNAASWLSLPRNQNHFFMRLLVKILVALVLLVLGAWLYLTEFKKYQIRRRVHAAREMIVTGKFDEDKLLQYASDILNICGQAITPSVRKDLEDYAGSFAKSGDPELFAAGVLVDQPYWKWANGIGRKHTLPACMSLLENLDKYPAASRPALENIIWHILPKASQQSFGMSGGKFSQDPEQRRVAIGQWQEWYKQNKDRVLKEDDQRMQAVDDTIRDIKRDVLRTKAAAEEFDVEIRPKAEK